MRRPIGVLAAVCVVATGIVAAMAGCSTPPTRPTSAALPVLDRNDIFWLERVSFGLDAQSIADYRRLGRQRFLERQLNPEPAALPAPIVAVMASTDEPTTDVPSTDVLPTAMPHTLAEVDARYKAINTLAAGPDKEEARKALNEQGNTVARHAVSRELLRAVYSPDQLQEAMTWFWLNHFSVHQAKGHLRWLVGDYADHAIRPHVFGHFKDLVLATLEHPAMLEYLDNSHNAAGHINENYARELMELHTLGVNGGYSQQDVQNLARVLTGVGVTRGEPPRLKRELRPLYVSDGAFEFNPARHDFGSKTLLGHAIVGKGFGEVEQAVDIIVSQPACAHFIAHELATYFVADDPPAALVDRAAHTFQTTHGDMAAVLRTLLLSREMNAALGGKFKDPMRFVVSAVRFAYDGKTIANTRPMINWLNELGEIPFGRQTPDGYPLTEANWASSGQMARRFDIARAIGGGSAGLSTGFPQLSNPVYFEAYEPFLAAATKQALEQAKSQQEWNTFLLSSPDFAYE